MTTVTKLSPVSLLEARSGLSFISYDKLGDDGFADDADGPHDVERPPPPQAPSNGPTKTPPPRQRQRPKVKVHPTVATLPMDVWFELPGEGEFIRPSPHGRQEDQRCRVCIQGPHGLLHVPVPEGSAPGDRVQFRIGPSCMWRATVPEGAVAGDPMDFTPPDGEQIEVRVPPGKEPGEEFDIHPRVLMVRVPQGAACDDWVSFNAPDGSERMSRVPAGTPPGQYFDQPLDLAVF